MKYFEHSERSCWVHPYPTFLSLRTWLSNFVELPSVPMSLCIWEVKVLFGQEQRYTAQLNAFYSGARPMAISLAFSLQDLGKCRTFKLPSKVDSAAQSFFIFNPHSDGNVARNICQQGIEWVWSRFAEFLLDYLILTLDTYASPCFYTLLTSFLWLHTFSKTVLVKLVCFFLILSLASWNTVSWRTFPKPWLQIHHSTALYPFPLRKTD